jgi:hypothetical protein
MGQRKRHYADYGTDKQRGDSQNQKYRPLRKSDESEAKDKKA